MSNLILNAHNNPTTSIHSPTWKKIVSQFLAHVRDNNSDFNSSVKYLANEPFGHSASSRIKYNNHFPQFSLITGSNCFSISPRVNCFGATRAFTHLAEFNNEKSTFFAQSETSTKANHS
ncbi:hypothetical protein IKO50_04240 [bacterium]|nr:hypothetical protein [bacterium]